MRFNTEISTSYFQIIVRILLFIAVYLCYTFKVIPKFYLNIYVIGFITYVFFFDLNQFSTRINMSFRVIELFTFAKLFNLKKVNFSRYIIKRLMMIYFLSLLTINIIQNV